MPEVDFPTIQVSGSLPGASPETMESSIAPPLENEFSTIDGVTSIGSASWLRQSCITIRFRLNRDVDAEAQDVQTAIAAALRKLPSDMTTKVEIQAEARQSCFPSTGAGGS